MRKDFDENRNKNISRCLDSSQEKPFLFLTSTRGTLRHTSDYTSPTSLLVSDLVVTRLTLRTESRVVSETGKEVVTDGT